MMRASVAQMLAGEPLVHHVGNCGCSKKPLIPMHESKGHEYIEQEAEEPITDT